MARRVRGWVGCGRICGGGGGGGGVGDGISGG